MTSNHSKKRQALDALKKARAHLVVRHPFFGCLALGLELVESDDTATLATDGSSIFYNVDFTLSLTLKELASVIAHEVLHVTFKHHLRRGTRDPQQWNVAADYAINGILIKSKLFNLPDGGLFDPKYQDWGTEKIYADLPKPEEDNQNDPGSQSGEADYGAGGPGQSADDAAENGGDADGPGDASEDSKPAPVGEIWDAKSDEGNELSPAEIASAERHIDSQIHIAAQAEKSIGTGSNAVADGILKGLSEVSVPWVDVLKDYLLATHEEDYSLNQPNRRFIHQGLYLPAPVHIPAGSLVHAIDISGSLSRKELEIIAANINDINDVLQPAQTHVIYCDTTIVNVDTFDAGEDITLTYYHGGGTEFAPPFNWCLANDVRPDALIYFTDGCGTVGGSKRLDEEPDYPVVWATSYKAPRFAGNEFGEVIKI